MFLETKIVKQALLAIATGFLSVQITLACCTEVNSWQKGRLWYGTYCMDEEDCDGIDTCEHIVCGNPNGLNGTCAGYFNYCISWVFCEWDPDGPDFCGSYVGLCP